jgi:23S rRNA (cytosine1962-C5)-methyltransferase
VREDYVDLLTQCFEALAEGGTMLVCRNDKKAKTSLEKLVKKAASRAGRKVANIEEAPPSDDFPSVEGFGEGVKFEGVWVVAK